jgi:hypothetical protein
MAEFEIRLISLKMFNSVFSVVSIGLKCRVQGPGFRGQ